MHSKAPTIQVVDSSKTIKPKSRGPQTSQQETQKLYRRIASMERTQKEQLKAIRDEQANQARKLREMPRHDIRADVRRLTLDPQKYERELTSLELYSTVRRTVRFYAPYSNPSDKYEEQPALVQFSWYDGGELTGLNPTEVEDLRDKLFLVHEMARERTFNRQSPYYVAWLKKEPTHLWLALRQDDIKGLCWCCCIAKHIRELRDQDKVLWKSTVPVTGSSLSLSLEEMEEIGQVGMIRESQAMFLAGDAIRDILPWEVWNDWPEAQAALAKLREDAVLATNTLIEDNHLQEDRYHLESADLKVVEYTPRS